MDQYHHTKQASLVELSVFAWELYRNCRREDSTISPSRVGLDEHHFGLNGQLNYQGIAHVRELVENNRDVKKAYCTFQAVQFFSRFLGWQRHGDPEILPRIW